MRNDPSSSPSTAAAAATHGSLTPRPTLAWAEPFSVGGVFGRGFGIYAKSFVPLTALTLLIFLPWLLSNAVSAQQLRDHPGQLSSAGWLTLALSTISTPVAVAAAIGGVLSVVRGRTLRPLASLRLVLPRVLPILGVTLLSSVAIGVGGLMCIVPGLILMAMFYVAMPALIVEGCGVIDALKRSAALTTGHRFGCFALALAPFLVNIPTTLLTAPLPFTLATGLTSLAGVASAAISAVLVTVAYVDLRHEQEPSFDADDLLGGP